MIVINYSEDTCKEWAQHISMKDCIASLSLKGDFIQDIPLFFTEKDLLELESLRYLIDLDIVHAELSRLPNCIRLKYLRVDNTNLYVINISPKIKLKMLICQNNLHLKSISRNLNASLKILTVEDCPLISSIPNHFINLNNIQITNCESFDSGIPKEFVNLTFLDIRCSDIDEIPKELVNLVTI